MLDKRIDAQIAAGTLGVDAAILQAIADFVRRKAKGNLLIFKPQGFEQVDGSRKDAGDAFWVTTVVNAVPTCLTPKR